MTENFVEKLIIRYPELQSQKESIENAVNSIVNTYNAGGKILIAGNGGSSADCEHVSGELLKGFISTRPPKGEKLENLSKHVTKEEALTLQEGVPAIPLTSLISTITAFSNDVGYPMSFAQLVYALGKKEDLLFAISTSGNSPSIIKAVSVAKALGIKVVALTGKTGGKIKDLADLTIFAPAEKTYLIQEYHLPIYHAICAQVEEELFLK